MRLAIIVIGSIATRAELFPVEVFWRTIRAEPGGALAALQREIDMLAGWFVLAL